MNIKRFVNALKRLPNVYKLSPKDRWDHSAEFLSPHLGLAVCNYLMIFMPRITLQLERQQAQGQRKERGKKNKWENLGNDIWVVEQFSACDLYQMLPYLYMASWLLPNIILVNSPFILKMYLKFHYCHLNMRSTDMPHCHFNHFEQSIEIPVQITPVLLRVPTRSHFKEVPGGST